MTSRVRLESSDGQVFEVEKKAILRSVCIAKKLQSRPKSDHSSPVLLDQINGKTLKKVIEYCNHHYVLDSCLEDDEDVINSLNAFDAQFVNVDQTTFFSLIQAAYVLDIKKLKDLTCGTLSKKIKGKNYKEIEEAVENW